MSTRGADGRRARKPSSTGRGRKATSRPAVVRESDSATHEALPALAPDAVDLADEDFNRRRTTNVTRPRGDTGPRQACLTVLSGPDEGMLFKLKPDTRLVLGRAPECDISLDDDGVSRTHAAIEQQGQQVFIEDLDSRNGTFIGHEPIRRAELSSDDLVRVGGNTVLKFSWMAETEEEHHERLKNAALRDSLTGLYNRRHFDDCIASERASALRHGKPMGLVVIDVDDFKQVNDEHGHLVGDHVLREVAQEVMQCARREDLVFRYGGEEFAVLARETDLRGALRLADRIRRRISRLQLRTRDDVRLLVTASIGVAELERGEAVAELIERADSAMYLAKRRGKDRVVGAGSGLQRV